MTIISETPDAVQTPILTVGPLGIYIETADLASDQPPQLFLTDGQNKILLGGPDDTRALAAALLDLGLEG